METKSPNIDSAGQFNGILWHDSKFLGMSIVRDEKQDSDLVSWSVLLRQSNSRSLKNARVVFEDATIVRANLDLAGKRVAADDISDASCMMDSELKRQIEKELRYETDPLKFYFHFQLNLVDPGGQINVFARSFRVVSGGYDPSGS